MNGVRMCRKMHENRLKDLEDNMEIKIEINEDTKQIEKMHIPKDLNPVDTLAIFTELTKYIISKLEYKNPSKIIKPKLVIKNNGGMQ